jgi:hypothetical protein
MISGPYTASSFNTTATFPVSYSMAEYNQSVVLGGFKMQYTNSIVFNLSLPVTTPTGATIQLLVGSGTTIVAMSMYILIVNKKSYYVFKN